MEFYIARPKTVSLDILWATTGADCDNLAKATLDALQDANVIVNDSRISSLSVSKKYESENKPSGAMIYIYRLDKH